MQKKERFPRTIYKRYTKRIPATTSVFGETIDKVKAKVKVEVKVKAKVKDDGLEQIRWWVNGRYYRGNEGGQ